MLTVRVHQDDGIVVMSGSILEASLDSTAIAEVYWQVHHFCSRFRSHLSGVIGGSIVDDQNVRVRHYRFQPTDHRPNRLRLIACWHDDESFHSEHPRSVIRNA
jgi:hypothetical protein